MTEGCASRCRCPAGRRPRSPRRATRARSGRATAFRRRIATPSMSSSTARDSRTRRCRRRRRGRTSGGIHSKPRASGSTRCACGGGFWRSRWWARHEWARQRSSWDGSGHSGGGAVSRPFEICGPLPTGITVLEASAGTGKTYTIAALAARYVAEGVPLDRLLLITFTRMATGELRERVRERLVSAERELALGTASDDVVRLLADGSPDQVALRRRRLAQALADFDSATIATTHSFCQEV